MLVPRKRTWWRVVLRYRGSELPRTKYRIAGVALLALVVTAAEELQDWHPNLTPLPLTLVGIALGIFLGFRNNAAYDRWWEGRKLWGAAVNVTRTFTRQILTLIVPASAEGCDADRSPAAEPIRALQEELVRRVVAWAHALRLSLRDERDLSDLRGLVPDEELARLPGETNLPYAITQGTAERLQQAWRSGWIHPMHLPLLERSMGALTDIQGGCERIKLTPIPFSYTTLIHRITAVYCYALPFGLVDTVGVLTPVVSVIVSYAFLGLDVVGDEIEMPFGFDANDLPLRSITRTIERNLLQRLGVEVLPPPMEPVAEILD